MTHWHVGHGAAGYGADSENTVTCSTLRAAAEAARDELESWADHEFETADQLAEAREFEDAWKMRKHVDEIDTLRQNLDNERANAPLYKDEPAKWDQTLMTLLNEHFPFSVDGGRCRVYAWECTMSDAVCPIAKESDR
jgi:hypothetical protein